MLTKREILRKLDTASEVLVHVRITENDGKYMKVTKAELRFSLRNFAMDDKINAVLDSDRTIRID